MPNMEDTLLLARLYAAMPKDPDHAAFKAVKQLLVEVKAVDESGTVLDALKTAQTLSELSAVVAAYAVMMKIDATTREAM